MATTAADAFVGDGALSMLMAELATCVKYGLQVKVVVVEERHARSDQVEADVPAECGLVREQALANGRSGTGSGVEDPLESHAGSGRQLAPGEPESGEDRPDGALGQAPRARLRSRWRKLRHADSSLP